MERSEVQFDSVPACIEDIRRGKIVIVVDDEDRENEGDFTMAAEKVTPEAINFMARFGRGLICVPVTREIAERLDLAPMVRENTSNFGTAFTVSVDARRGTTTGISAYDRARTVQVIADPESRAEDLARPGHVFPLIARRGGVLRRAGQTEAAVDLARLAGLQPAGVICEIMNEDGSMARLPELLRLREEHGLKIMTVASLIAHRVRTESLVEVKAETVIPTRLGTFRAICYGSQIDELHHLAFVKGTISEDEPVLVRVHSSCLTGDVFHSLRCDCGEQLEAAMRMIEAEGTGVLLYMNQEGRGIGLVNKLRAYMLQDAGRDTVQANLELGFKPDERDYGIGAQILRHLGVRKIRLLTNNMRKFVALRGYGLEVVERVPIEVPPSKENLRYLRTKREKLGHLLTKI
jgi:3,4-dihydroxy 2-butanone 4-phosphate synthase/GTP cyclohydrolase II